MDGLTKAELAAYGREPGRVAKLLSVLFDVATGALASKPETVVRLASVAASVFGDPSTALAPGELERVFALKSVIDQLFEATAFGSADFLLRHRPDLTEAGPDDAAAALRFALQSIDSELDLPLDWLTALPPRLAQLAVIALIATKPVRTLEGQRRRDRLLELASALSPASIPATTDHLVKLATAWMYCSYADGPRKHGLKPVLNRTLRRLAADIGLADAQPPPARTLKPRPTMVVAAEIMNSHHVQYRYFGQYLRQLRQRFHLVLVTDRREVDEHVETLFDQVLSFERKANGNHLGEIVGLITQAAPDVVFWPSVGMRHWGPLIANLRLAPIQFTALGHSASTFCETVDYYLLEEGYVSEPALFSETVVTLPDESLRFERSPYYTPIAPVIRDQASPLRIALPSNILKLNPGFLTVVAKIRQAARRPLEIHLFPASSGLEADAFVAGLQRILPGAHVHRNMAYPRYLNILSACDLVLSPFPFGGLHSVVDALRQGLPVVAMECPEPHGRTDAMLLRRLGMPEWLIAGSEEAYVEAALRVIEDDAVRVALSRQALALDIDNTLYGDASTPLRSEVVEAVWWLYQNHEAIQASGRKAWSAADRAAGP